MVSEPIPVPACDKTLMTRRRGRGVYLVSCIPEGEMDFAEDIIYCDEEYQALIETFKARVTFQQFVSIKNPRGE